jgi:hypothetical protein
MQHIMENWRKYNNEPFQLMLEQYDKKILSEKQLFEIWQKDTLRELEQLNEIDWEKEAELTADPDYKPPQERPGMLAKGWEKVNDWILMKSIQLVDLAKRSAMAAIKSIAWLIKKVQSFCSEHKTICKIAIMTLVVIAFYIAMAFLFENEAQAKLYRSGKPLSDELVNGLKGELYDIIEAKKEQGGDTEGLIKLMAEIDELHQAKGKHDFINAKTKVDKGLEILYDGLRDAVKGEGDWKGTSEEDRTTVVNRWLDIGSRVRAWWRETIYKIDFQGQKGTRTQSSWGLRLLKKGAEAATKK